MSVFGAKIVVKWVIIITPSKIDYGPISRLYPQLTPNFLWPTERISRVKDNENKRAQGKKRRRARKKNRKGPAKKKSNFGLCASAKLKKKLYICVPNLQEIQLFGRKSLFHEN